MRATATSCANSPTLAHVRTAPPAAELAELSFGDERPPSSASSTAPSDADTMQWAHGYSGCMGVSMNGVQLGARAVASLPSTSPLRMAVTGRQRLYVYFASKTATSASSIAIAAIARSRAFSVTSRPGVAAPGRAPVQETAGAVASQNLAMAVCSGLRWVLFFPPIALISL